MIYVIKQCHIYKSYLRLQLICISCGKSYLLLILNLWNESGIYTHIVTYIHMKFIFYPSLTHSLTHSLSQSNESIGQSIILTRSFAHSLSHSLIMPQGHNKSHEICCSNTQIIMKAKILQYIAVKRNPGLCSKYPFHKILNGWLRCSLWCL